MHTLAALRSGALKGLTRVDLRGGLTTFPPELYTLADTLEVLDLSDNQLSTLPDDLPRLHRLRVLFASNNRFTTLPEVLGQCQRLEMIGFKANQISTVPADALPPRLRWLTLTDNQITTLPDAIGRCTRLQKLLLAGNRLTALPDALLGCRALELLRVSANAIATLPEGLLDLPRLCWLAAAGNPGWSAVAGEPAAPAGGSPDSAAVAELPWSALTLEGLLGEGASGVIHQARLNFQGVQSTVAVKLFKGTVTSDGLPMAEMAACLRAGPHRHLLGALGRLTGHPSGLPGLVMARVPARYNSLAGPPSLASCTRDMYPPGRRMGLGVVLRMALGIASATAHLHARGVLHGDLYAHNTMVDGQGDALLGDFGAAALYDPARTALAARLQRLEVRALGLLLQELVQQVLAPADATTPAAQALQALASECISEVPGLRPRPVEVVQRVEALSNQSLSKA